MNAAGKIVLKLNPIRRILGDKGLAVSGDVQRFHTNNVNKRIGKYMPHLTGALETKSKHIKSDTEIEVLGPYARVMYYGKLMVDPVTGAAGFLDKDGQWKSRKNIPKVQSDRDITYTKTFNPQAGPFWDRRLVAAEGAAMQKDLQAYVRRKG